MGKIRIKTSPLTQAVSKVQHEKICRLVAEVDALLRKHGYDTYLLSLKSPVGEDVLYSTVFCPSDSEDASRLLQDAARTYYELCLSQQPTAPGGTA